MDDVRFQALYSPIGTSQGEGRVPVTGIEINGTGLREILRSNLRRARSRQDASDALPVDDFGGLPGSLAFTGHWLGDSHTRYRIHHWHALFICSCGDFGCGGVGARITVSQEVPDTVVWSDFADSYWIVAAFWDPEGAPYRSWMREAYALTGPFRFAADQYRTALDRLRLEVRPGSGP